MASIVFTWWIVASFLFSFFFCFKFRGEIVLVNENSGESKIILYAGMRGNTEK